MAVVTAQARTADARSGASQGVPPPVSVVVAARHAGRTLPAALRALLAQDYGAAVEIIVAEGSADPAQREGLRRDFPGVRVLHNKAGTIPAGLNLALAAAGHAVIVRCDAHTVLPAGYIARAVETLQRTGAANVGGYANPAGPGVFRRAVALAASTPLGAGDARFRIGGPEGPVDTVFPGVYRRAALEAAGGWDETLLANEDYALNWRLREAGGTVWFDPALVADYRPRGSLGALARQYFDYGRWKREMLRRHPRSLRARQVAPPLLLAALAVSALLAAAGLPALPFPASVRPLMAGAAAAVPLAYLLGLLAAAVLIGVTRRAPEAVLLPLVAATIHLSWAAGFFSGVRREKGTEWDSVPESGGRSNSRPGPAVDPDCGAVALVPSVRSNGARSGLRAMLARIRSEARHVRGTRTAWGFLKWFAGALRWRLRAGGGWTAAPVPAAARHADPPLGAAIALSGPRAQAVFAASSNVLQPGMAGQADVILADARPDTAGNGAPVATLEAHPQLAVPAFDPALDNPVGWVREVEPRGAMLGDPRLLPAQLPAHRRVGPDDRDALRHCHHLVDVAAFHADAAGRAGTLARIAARGVPVCLADRDPVLAMLLGGELYGLTAGAGRGRERRNGPDGFHPPGLADTRERELLSIAQRRAALRTHSLRARARQVCAAAGAVAPKLPLVSVLLATCRPAFLKAAAAGVAGQSYPRLELVLALHGPGFTTQIVEAALAGFTRPVKLLRIGTGRTLGEVLQAASAAAGGSLLAKMDDDDAYGPEHLWDLVLAHEYSGATLVGKFPATVYLSRRDQTVRRRAVPGETWSRSITGGAMLLRRADLKRAGGWRDVPRHVDEVLVDDVLRSGGTVYRTHDSGYLLVRHGAGHTWQVDEARLLAGAETVLDGWQPQLAGIAAAPPPPPVVDPDSSDVTPAPDIPECMRGET